MVVYSRNTPALLQKFKHCNMEQINLYAELDKASINRQGLAPIVIRFDIRSKHIGRNPLKIKIEPVHWDNEKKEIKQSHPQALFLNKIIYDRLNAHRDFIFKRQAFGLETNAETIKKHLKTEGGFESFYVQAKDIINTRKLDDGKELGSPTKRRYHLELKRMMQFQPELSFKQITPQWLTSYRNWMQTTYVKKNGKPMHKNGIQKAFAFIRMAYNEAIARKIIVGDASLFKDFKVGSYEQQTDKIKWLEKTDMEKLEETLLNKSMPDLTRRVGWRFLAMCVTGMRISDAMQFKADFFNDRGDLQFKPYKTKRHQNEAHVPIVSESQHRYFQMTLANPLPQIESENFRNTFNDHLKILAALAGIDVHLTSHVGRHTMGGLLVDAGIETRPAMKMLGIKSKKTIETYMHLKEEKLRTEANKLKNFL